VVEFASKPGQTKCRQIEMVLDYNELGCVIGMEILGLVFGAGKDCLGLIGATVPARGDVVKYSYDEDCDAFYLRLRMGRSLRQGVVQGTACFDSGGRIISLSAKW